MSDGFSLSMLNNGSSLNLVTEMRNKANAASQEWFRSDKRLFGTIQTSGGPVVTTKDTGVAGKILTINVQKASAGYSVVMNWLDISICGAGIP